MTVRDLFTEIRYQISDEKVISYSDDELLTYLNQAHRFIYSVLINHSSSITLKSVELDTTNGEVSLPDDFLIEDSVLSSTGELLHAVSYSTKLQPSNYKIIGNTLYTLESKVTLIYHYDTINYTKVTDEITLPSYFINLYKEAVIFYTLNSDEYNTSVEQEMLRRIENTVLSLSVKRGNTAIKDDRMPFKV